MAESSDEDKVGIPTTFWCGGEREENVRKLHVFEDDDESNVQ